MLPTRNGNKSCVGEFAALCYDPPPMRLLLLALLVLFAVGCQPTSPVPARVRGTVTVNGRPLRGGTIVFVPDRQRGNRGDMAYAVVANDGSFELKAGAVSGWHRITVAPTADAVELAQRLEKYRYPDQSGLSREVKAGILNVFDIPIEVEP